MITSKHKRSSRSARNFSASTIFGRFSFVAPTIRTSTLIGRDEPIRVTSPYSTARSSRSCAPILSVPSSSRNNVPPSASSKRPSRARVAPVKAPASCPNNSASISVSGSAAQFIVINGPPQRALRRCRRSAISSLPVPRSPTTSTGRFSGAARLARSTASRKAEDWPINCASRSIFNVWHISPCNSNKYYDTFARCA